MNEPQEREEQSNPQESHNHIESLHSIPHEQEQRDDQSSVKQSTPKKVTTRLRTSQASSQTGWKFWKRQIENLLSSIPWTIFMAIITFYALFGDDIRVLATDKDGDVGFWVVTLICLCFFVIELILASIVQVIVQYRKKDGYFLGFFFWLDVLSTVSMLLDVGWISDAIFGGSNSAVSAVKLARQAEDIISRAGRASRVGTRAGRIVRVIRLIRLSKLYKAAKQQLEKEAQQLLENEEQGEEVQPQNLQIGDANPQQISRREGEQHERKLSSNTVSPLKHRTSLSYVGSGAESQNQSSRDAGLQRRMTRRMQKTQMIRKSVTNRATIVRKNSSGGSMGSGDKEIIETNVGKQLTETTNKRVITIVMLILFSIPILNRGTYKEDAVSYDTGLEAMLLWKTNLDLYEDILRDYINYHANLRIPLVYLSVNDTILYPTQDPNRYERIRTSALTFYAIDYQGSTAVSIEDSTEDEQLNAILSIARTIFVSVVLSLAAVLFSQDVQELVLTPVEKMLSTVVKIAQNPLKAAADEENEAFIQMTKKGELQNFMDKQDEKLETVVLQKLIVKIGALLALGFGEAGSEIIATNMSGGNSINPMLPGKKVMAIFGFCDIRNFTDATEVLQQDVMVFVNEIAEIVHGTVDHFSGSANKNIGDAFLLVWKFADSDYQPDSEGNLELKPYDHVSQIADMAVLSFVSIITSVTSSPKLHKYKIHQGLNQRIPNYSVKMGFGLHLGWAIEGAIGSEYKIDASYLSPNVNMASRLEAATKQFGSFMLVSGQVYNVTTRETKRHLRQIDKVTVKGSIEPLDIFTVDLNLEQAARRLSKRTSMIQTKPDGPYVPLDEETKKKRKVIRRMKRDKLKQQVQRNQIRISEFWVKDPQIKMARQGFSEEFYAVWEKGFDSYIKGDWEMAKSSFEKTLTMLPNYRDGPSNTLLRVITEEPFLRNNWKGYRELTEK